MLPIKNKTPLEQLKLSLEAIKESDDSNITYAAFHALRPHNTSTKEREVCIGYRDPADKDYQLPATLSEDIDLRIADLFANVCKVRGVEETKEVQAWLQENRQPSVVESIGSQLNNILHVQKTEELIEEFVENKNLEALVLSLQTFNIDLPVIAPFILFTATSYGFIPALEWITSRHNFSSKEVGDALYEAATEGNLETVQWLCAYDGNTSSEAISDALTTSALEGKLEVIKWLMNNKTDLLDTKDLIKAFIQSVHNEHTDVSNYFMGNLPIDSKNMLFRATAIKGNIAILEAFLLHKSISESVRIELFRSTYSSKNMKIFQLILKYGAIPREVQKSIFEHACKKNRVDAVRILLSEGNISPFIKQKLFNTACSDGNIKIFRAFAVPRDLKAEERNKGLLQAFLEAIRTKNHRALQALFECRFIPSYIKEEAFQVAAYYGNTDALIAIATNHGEFVTNQTVCQAFIEAARGGEIGALDILFQNHKESITDESVRVAFEAASGMRERHGEENAKIGTLTFIREHYPKVLTKNTIARGFINTAAINGVQGLEWILSNYKEMIDLPTVNAALQKANTFKFNCLGTVRFLNEHFKEALFPPL